MDSLQTRALSWVIVAVVGLSPILVVFVAGTIRWALRRRLRRRSKASCSR